MTRQKQALINDSTSPAIDFSPVYGKILLVDGDIFRYRCAFAAQKTHYLVTNQESEGLHHVYDDKPENYREAMKAAKECPPGANALVWNRKEVQPVENALQATKTAIETVVDKLKPKSYTVYLSGKHNFRDAIAVSKPYKGNRDGVERPVHFKAVGDYLIYNHGATYTDGIEADDAIGISATALGSESIVVSNDKDLRQLAGWHFDWTEDNLFQISKRDAAFAFYSQLLTGDATDNIPGLDGVGPVAAKKLLDGATGSKDLFLRTWYTYRARYAHPEDAWKYMMEQANLLYILRESPEERYVPLMTYEEANAD